MNKKKIIPLILSLSMIVNVISSSFSTVYAQDTADSTKNNTNDAKAKYVFMADTHITGGGDSGRLNYAFNYINKLMPDGYDGLVIAGDMVSDGSGDSQMKYVQDILDEYNPQGVKKCVVRGNHDPVSAMETLNKEYYPSEYYNVKMGGYDFLMCDSNNFNSTQQSWLSSQLKEITSRQDYVQGSPIFMVMHAPLSGTVLGSGSSFGQSSNVYNILKEYPQVVVLSGHSHNNIQDERSIHQRDFTSVHLGGMQYIEFDESHIEGLVPAQTGLIHEDGSQSQMNQAVIASVYDDKITFDRYDFSIDRHLGTWEIELPVSKENFTYTKNNRDKQAPAFKDVADITFNTISSSDVEFSYPQAEDDNFVYDYSIELKKGDTKANSVLTYSQFYASKVPQTKTNSFSGLSAQTDYTIEITARDSMGNASKKLTKTFTTTSSGEKSQVTCENPNFNLSQPKDVVVKVVGDNAKLKSVRYGDTALVAQNDYVLSDGQAIISKDYLKNFGAGATVTLDFVFDKGDPTELSFKITSDIHTIKTYTRNFEDSNIDGIETYRQDYTIGIEKDAPLAGTKSLKITTGTKGKQMLIDTNVPMISDGIVEFDIKPTGTDVTAMSFIIRGADDQNHIAIGCDGVGDWLWSNLKNGLETYALLANDSVPLKAGKNYHIKMSFYGDKYEVYVDDTCVIRTVIPGLLTDKGYIGLHNWGSTSRGLIVDNVKVTYAEENKSTSSNFDKEAGNWIDNKGNSFNATIVDDPKAQDGKAVYLPNIDQTKTRVALWKDGGLTTDGIIDMRVRVVSNREKTQPTLGLAFRSPYKDGHYNGISFKGEAGNNRLLADVDKLPKGVWCDPWTVATQEIKNNEYYNIQVKYVGSEITISVNDKTIVKDFGNWSEWNTAAGYAGVYGWAIPGDYYIDYMKVTKLSTATAGFTVKFESNGGSSVNTLEDIVGGKTIVRPEDPQKKNCRFIGWYKDSSCTNPWNFDSDLVEKNTTLFAKWEAKSGENINIWTASSNENVFKENVKSENSPIDINLSCAKNEFESSQILLRNSDSFKINDVTFTDLKNESNVISADNFKFNYVDYEYLTNNSGGQSSSTVVKSAPGDFPDALSNEQAVEVLANKTQPIWMRVYVPKGTPAGKYKGEATVSTSIGSYKVPINVDVYDVTIPDSKDAKFSFSFWSNLAATWFNEDDLDGISVLYGYEKYSKEWWKLIDDIAQLMKDNRSNNLMINTGALLRDSGSYIDEKGNYQFNWSKFDEYINHFIDKGVVKNLEGLAILECVYATTYKVPVLLPNNAENAKYPLKRVSLDYGSNEANKWLEQYIPAFTSHIAEKGWDKIWIQHIGDEPFNIEAQTSKWSAVKNMVKKFNSNIRCGDPYDNSGCGDAMLKMDADIYFPILSVHEDGISFYDNERAKGKEVYMYTCLNPQGSWLNRLVDKPVWQMKTIGWLSYNHNVTGHLHWGLNEWLKNTTTIYNQIPMQGFKGDNFTIYPDIDFTTKANGEIETSTPRRPKVKSSIRYDATRDACEDYEIFKILEKRDIAKAKEIANSIAKTGNNYSKDIAYMISQRKLLLQEASIKPLSKEISQVIGDKIGEVKFSFDKLPDGNKYYCNITPSQSDDALKLELMGEDKPAAYVEELISDNKLIIENSSYLNVVEVNSQGKVIAYASIKVTKSKKPMASEVKLSKEISVNESQENKYKFEFDAVEGENKILNGDFEKGQDQWTNLKNFTVVKDEVSNSKVACDGTATGGSEQQLKGIVPGATYVFKASARSTRDGQIGWATIESPGRVVKKDLEFTSIDYKEKSLNVVLPSSVNSLKALTYKIDSSDGKGGYDDAYFYVDNMSLKSVNIEVGSGHVYFYSDAKDRKAQDIESGEQKPNEYNKLLTNGDEIDRKVGEYFNVVEVDCNNNVVALKSILIGGEPTPEKTFTTTFNIDGKETVVVTNAGETIVMPATPVKDGYEFKGWFTAATEGTEVTNFDTVQTVYAQWIHVIDWTPVKFATTFYIDGKETVVATNVGEKIVMPAIPTKDGYKFKGWFTAATEGTEVTNFDTVQTVYAQFSKNLTPEVPKIPINTTTYGNTTLSKDVTVEDANKTGMSAFVPKEVTNVTNPKLINAELPNWAITSREFAAAANKFDIQKTFIINLFDSETKVTKVEGGKIKIEIPFAGVEGKEYVVLRYNDDKTVTELKATYADGKISFETDHFSVYAVAVKAVANTKPTIAPKPAIIPKTTTNVPKTGDTTPLGSVMILFVLAGTLILARKKLCK